ncbi:hypothetical protein AAHA92_04156 [Salvia divinorum]|uniref:Uncharacterized protein n=1 Tax=Salvia divinorum TaxID=28513 RepID=A0ABD1HYA0_SALDI
MNKQQSFIFVCEAAVVGDRLWNISEAGDPTRPKWRLNLVVVFLCPCVVLGGLTIGFAKLTAFYLVGGDHRVVTSTFMNEFAVGMMCYVLVTYLIPPHHFVNENHIVTAAVLHSAVQLPGIYIVRIFGINTEKIFPDVLLFDQIVLAALIWTVCAAFFCDRMRTFLFAKMQAMKE